jgi:hypothetical protein
VLDRLATRIILFDFSKTGRVSMDLQSALRHVYNAIDSANELRRREDWIPKVPDVQLAGQDGALDSLGLATLLLSVERSVEDESGRAISILDEASVDVDGQFAKMETPSALAKLILEKLGS